MNIYLWEEVAALRVASASWGSQSINTFFHLNTITIISLIVTKAIPLGRECNK